MCKTEELAYMQRITEAFIQAKCLVHFMKDISQILGMHCAVLGEKMNDLSMTQPPEEHAFTGEMRAFCQIETDYAQRKPIYLGIPVEAEPDAVQRFCLQLAASFLPKFPEISQPVAFNSDTYLDSLYAFLFSNDFNQMSSLRVRLSLSQLKLYQEPPNCVLINIRTLAQQSDLSGLRAELERRLLTVHDSMLQYGGALILLHLFKTPELEEDFTARLDTILREQDAIGCASDVFKDPIRDFRIRIYLSRNEQVLDYLCVRNWDRDKGLFFYDAFKLVALCRSALEDDKRLCVRNWDRDKGLFFYDAFKLVALCRSALEDDKRLGKNQFVCRTALRIHSYDCKHDTEYLRTLLVYLNSRFSLSSTCKILHIHRNTVIYRIERLKTMFGVDFDSPWDCFNLLLSCHILDITKHM